MLEPQRLPGLRADLRIAEPGDIEVSALSRRNAQQVNSGSRKSAGAGYRSTSRTTLPAPGHRIPRTLKYLSGLVFRSDAAAGRYVVSVPTSRDTGRVLDLFAGSVGVTGQADVPVPLVLLPSRPP